MHAKKVGLCLLGILLVAFVLTGCQKDKETEPVAPLPTPALPPAAPLVATEWSGTVAETICLNVEQTYPTLTTKSPEPIDMAITDILSGLGLIVVSADQPCDATLNVSIAGGPLNATYQRVGTCSTGASYVGAISLSRPAHNPLVLSFSGVHTPRETILESGPCPTPEEAPFAMAWPEETVRILHALWGDRVLVQALAVPAGYTTSRNYALRELKALGNDAIPLFMLGLADANTNVRAESATEIGQFGPDAVDAVPLLIANLRRASSHEQEATLSALGAITGQDMGNDASRWEKWWSSLPPLSTPSDVASLE